MALYPDIEPFAMGRLRVSDLHDLYYEQLGSPTGKAAVFLHGGPGGGIDPYYRRFFDPARYHAVLFDQRGAGKSTPWASIEDNTTQDLINDIEKLREDLGIERWQVFGGSWGSTLALAYAEAYPQRVTELVLRGIFLLREKEIHWFYQHGASVIFPDAWDHFLAPIPVEERHDLLHAYHRRLTSGDREVMLKAARAWSRWEGSTSRLHFDAGLADALSGDEFAEVFARIECHYFVNKGFLREGQLLEEVERIRHIPCVMVQGRYDLVCPIESAWELHRAWPESELIIVPDAGHSAREEGIADALRAAADRFAS